MTEIKRPFGRRGGCHHHIFVCGACLTEYCDDCRSYQCPHPDHLDLKDVPKDRRGAALAQPGDGGEG